VIDAPIRDGVEVLNTADGWYPAIDSSGATRRGAWVAEATKLVDLSKTANRHPADPIRCWPNGSFTRNGRLSRAYTEDDAKPKSICCQQYSAH
jgi:hypothetical protein